MSRSSKRPSAAMIVAILALVVAMSGTGYAALRIPANSVGTAQLKANAVTSAKVRNGSLQALDFAPGTLLKGATGVVATRSAQGGGSISVPSIDVTDTAVRGVTPDYVAGPGETAIVIGRVGAIAPTLPQTLDAMLSFSTDGGTTWQNLNFGVLASAGQGGAVTVSDSSALELEAGVHYRFGMRYASFNGAPFTDAANGLWSVTALIVHQ